MSNNKSENCENLGTRFIDEGVSHGAGFIAGMTTNFVTSLSGIMNPGPGQTAYWETYGKTRDIMKERRQNLCDNSDR